MTGRRLLPDRASGSGTFPAAVGAEARSPWLVPQWPLPAGVRALCTTRAGGMSLPPYDAFNLGDHVGDAPEAVAAHRRVLAQQLGARPVFLQQVHGASAVRLDASTLDATVADACWTADAGIACTIMVADCLPVLMAAPDGRAVAAAHAGWRGLAGGVVEHALGALCDAAGAPASAITVWLGPCIGPQAFEVGDEVREAFVAEDAAAAALFAPHGRGKWLADLAGLARQRLTRAGVAQVHGNDGSAPWCTVGNPSVFFSHRRDRVSGRFAACIWREA
jgi:YfiH family protein